MTQTLLELHVWLAILGGLMVLLGLLILGIWIYAAIDFIRLILKIRRH